MNDVSSVITSSGFTAFMGKKALISCADLSIPKGRVTAIIGPNGAGKTSLLKALTGLLPITGNIEVLGKPLGDHQKNAFAWVAQHGASAIPLSVREYVMLGRYPHLGVLNQPRQSDFDLVNKALKQTELVDFAPRRFVSLSGGERQRAVIARALVQQSPIMCLDEPTNHLDLRHQHILLHWLKELAVFDHTSLVVLHDLSLAAQYADHLILVQDGEVIAKGDAHSVLTATNLEMAYQCNLRPHSHPSGNWHFEVDFNNHPLPPMDKVFSVNA